MTKFGGILKFLGLFIATLTCGWGCSSPESEGIDYPGFFAWVESDSLQKWTLQLDTAEINKHKEDEKYCPGSLRLRKGGSELNIPVELSCRGKTRKKICDFPPLKIRVYDSLLNAESLAPYNSYKLVTHCMKEDSLEELLLKEYLTYQLYELVSPYAFKTQLLLINYQDKANESTDHAFLLEDDKEMAGRLEASLLDDDNKAPSSIFKPVYQKLVFFQYMVGNTDWNLSQYHNLKMLQVPELSSPVPVPYDFDYSGLIDAPYATPYPSLPIKTVRERLFQYRGKESDDLEPVREEFLQLKPAIMDKVNSFDYLSREVRDDMVQYLSGFYEILESENWKARLFRNR